MRTRAIDLCRGLAAAGVLLSAVIHLDLYATGFRGVPTIGPLFLLNAAGGLLIGVLLVTWRHWLACLLAIGFGAATVGAYWISVVHGLFGVREVTGGWSEVSAEVAEYVAVVCGAGALWLMRRPRTARVRR